MNREGDLESKRGREANRSVLIAFQERTEGNFDQPFGPLSIKSHSTCGDGDGGGNRTRLPNPSLMFPPHNSSYSEEEFWRSGLTLTLGYHMVQVERSNTKWQNGLGSERVHHSPFPSDGNGLGTVWPFNRPEHRLYVITG